MAITGLSADLLTAYAQGGRGRALAQASPSAPPPASAANASAEQGLARAPWDAGESTAPASDRVRDALAGRRFFDTSPKAFAATGAAADERKLFSLHSGLSTLAAVLSRYGEEGVGEMERSRLDRAFTKGLEELDDFLAQTAFDGLTLSRGARMETATSASILTATARTFLSRPLVKGDPAQASPLFAGEFAFTIKAIGPDGLPLELGVDLAAMTGGTRSLERVAAYLNTTLATAGLTSTVAVEKVGEGAPGAGPLWGLKVNAAAGEALEFAPLAATPALYLTSGAKTLLKFDADPDAPTSLSQPARGGVFAQGLPEGIGAVRASATGPDGSLYVVADLGEIEAPEPAKETSKNLPKKEAEDASATPKGPATEPIKGESDVALFKFDSAGRLLSTRTLGAAGRAQGFALAVSQEGKVAVAGAVTGLLQGALTGAGAAAEGAIGAQQRSDAFLTLYDADGAELWTVRDAAAADDQADAVTFGADGAVYVAGKTNSALSGQSALGLADGYLRGYSAAGAGLFATQFGTAGADAAQAIIVEDVAASGVARITVGGVESGRLTLRQIEYGAGVATETARRDLGAVEGRIAGLALSDGALYVAGAAGAGGLSLSAVNAHSGKTDAFVAKLAPDLAASGEDRVSYIGGTGAESVAGFAVSAGEVWLAGDSGAGFAGQSALRENDGFIARLDADGALARVQRFAQAEGAGLTSFALAQTGASVLDRLGLPSGVLEQQDSDALIARTALRAGDAFQVAVDARPAKTVTIGDDETLESLAEQVEAVLRSGGAAKVSSRSEGDKLEITAARGKTVTLTAGARGEDALGALGLAEGVIASATEEDGKARRKKPDPAYGLGLSGGLDITSKLGRKLAAEQLGAALSTVQRAHRTLGEEQSEAFAGPAPAYLQKQLANYQAALSRLTGGP